MPDRPDLHVERAEEAAAPARRPSYAAYRDVFYEERRAELERRAENWDPDEVHAEIDYHQSEHSIWTLMRERLQVRHESLAHPQIREAMAALTMPVTYVPSLDEVNARLTPLTGWRYAAVPGLVSRRAYYERLATRTFGAALHLRHPSDPLHAPEPDIVHDLLGHGGQVAAPRFARLHELAGLAVARLEDDASVEFLGNVHFAALEFGVVADGERYEVVGAAILSSLVELEQVRSRRLVDLDLVAMGAPEPDPGALRTELHRARSLAEFEDVIGGFFEEVDDDLVARLRSAGPAPA